MTDLTTSHSAAMAEMESRYRRAQDLDRARIKNLERDLDIVTRKLAGLPDDEER